MVLAVLCVLLSQATLASIKSSVDMKAETAVWNILEIGGKSKCFVGRTTLVSGKSTEDHSNYLLFVIIMTIITMICCFVKQNCIPFF